MSTVHVPPSSPDLDPGRRTAEVVGDATDAGEKYRGVESSHGSSARDTRGGRVCSCSVVLAGKGGCYECLKLRHQRNPGSSGERRDDLGGGSSVTSLDREIWGASGVLYTDWKNVYKRKATAGEQMRGKNSGYAACTHGAEAGHSDRRRQDAPGQGPGGAEPTDPSGSADQETAAERDRLLRSRQGLSGKRISAGAQPTVCGSSSSAGGLSRSQPTARELREIFRLETERGIGNDWVIRHEGGNLQLTPGSRRYGPTPSKTLVSEWEDGTMEVYYRGEVIAFTELKKQPQ